MSWFPDSRHVLVSGGNFNNTLSFLDTADGSSRVIYRGTDTFQAAVSPDGKKIAYAGGAAEWDILEVSLPEGRVRTLVGGGGVSWQPDWAPSGTHYLYATFVTGAVPGIEDRYATEGFSIGVAPAAGLIFSNCCFPPGSLMKATHWPSGDQTWGCARTPSAIGVQFPPDAFAIVSCRRPTGPCTNRNRVPWT